MWKDDSKCEIIGAADNIVHTLIQLDLNKHEVLISFIYGSTYTDPKKIQWDFL